VQEPVRETIRQLQRALGPAETAMRLGSIKASFDGLPPSAVLLEVPSLGCTTVAQRRCFDVDRDAVNQLRSVQHLCSPSALGRSVSTGCAVTVADGRS
jgi:hypothetical protein